MNSSIYLFANSPALSHLTGKERDSHTTTDTPLPPRKKMKFQKRRKVKFVTRA